MLLAGGCVLSDDRRYRTHAYAPDPAAGAGGIDLALGTGDVDWAKTVLYHKDTYDNGFNPNKGWRSGEVPELLWYYATPDWTAAATEGFSSGHTLVYFKTRMEPVVFALGLVSVVAHGTRQYERIDLTEIDAKLLRSLQDSNDTYSIQRWSPSGTSIRLLLAGCDQRDVQLLRRLEPVIHVRLIHRGKLLEALEMTRAHATIELQRSLGNVPARLVLSTFDIGYADMVLPNRVDLSDSDLQAMREGQRLTFRLSRPDGRESCRLTLSPAQGPVAGDRERPITISEVGPPALPAMADSGVSQEPPAARPETPPVALPVADWPIENIAVAQLSAFSVAESEAKTLTEKLHSTLLETGYFRILSRNDMEAVLEAQRYNRSDACDETQCLMEMGRLLSVEKIVGGSIGKVGMTYSLTLRLVDVETGNGELSVDEEVKGAADDLLEIVRHAGRRLAAEYARHRTTP